MPLDDNETSLLRDWIIKKLENISDADSDVLADYVLALVKSEEPKSSAEANYVENLQDFLLDNTQKFVQDLLEAISSKSFDLSRPPPKPAAPIYSAPKRQSFDLPYLPNPRKRGYHDWDREEGASGQIQSAQNWERPMKQQRRGGRGVNQREGRQMSNGYQYPSQSQAMPQMPTPPPGMPPFDPNNPMATIMAMHQAMSTFPGFQNGASPSDVGGYTAPTTGQRCRDYDLKGFCAAGASCPYEHGNDPFVVPGFNNEYDPNNSNLIDVTPTRVGHINTEGNHRGRGGGRGRGRGGSNFRGGGKRSEVSQVGPNRDRAITSIVVEQIPADKYNGQAVQDFFSEFGRIEEVHMQPAKNMAIVKYDTYEAAQRAYESPRSVFDNRFVKVYWHKPTTSDRSGDQGRLAKSKDPKSVDFKHEGQDHEMEEAEPIDLKEVAKRQGEAQRKHEESTKQREATEKQRKELDAKLKAMEAERKKMADLIARKTSTSASPVTDSSNQDKLEDSEQTKTLKEQLAKVEAEAKSLGIDPDASTTASSSGYPSYRGRGGYRARGSGRGFYSGYRGGWNGAGGRGGAVMRLDNRPKTVAVTIAEGSYDKHDEALRQFLLFSGLDTASLSKHPQRDDTALVAFNQRYEGENFMNAAGNSEILHIGKVELSWYKPDVEDRAPNPGGSESDVKAEMEGTTGTTETHEMEEEPSSDIQIIDGYEGVEEEDLDRWT